MLERAILRPQDRIHATGGSWVVELPVAQIAWAVEVFDSRRDVRVIIGQPLKDCRLRWINDPALESSYEVLS